MPKITKKNFHKYFFPAKEDYKPQKGQTLARWRARADFVDGWEKRSIIQMLCTTKSGAVNSVRVMCKLVDATEREAVRVLREMAEDLLFGRSVQEVAAKPYRFTLEQFYWTKREYIPDDPHWDVINTVDLRDVECESKISVE